MRTGRPIPPLTLTDDERDTLERWSRRPTTAQALAARARVILGCAAGQSNTAVARELGLTKQTIGKWRTRFLSQRLDGLLDEPRPGAPRRIGDAEVERVMRLTLETAPRDATPLKSIREPSPSTTCSRMNVHHVSTAPAAESTRSMRDMNATRNCSTSVV